MALTQVSSSMLEPTAQFMGFKNRLINGAMMIDQRNAGAAVTTSGSFPVDRFTIGNAGTTATFSMQQSSTAPADFVNSVAFTVTASDATLDASDRTYVTQSIEGLNIADLGWGTANAATVTLSFWVRSSLTGTFGGSLRNSAGNRSYPFTYAISAANTWEQKSVTIAGDTSGTWLTTNGVGISVHLGLGVGSTLSGTAGSWAGANYLSATGSVSLMQTNGATFYITGVQLEKGSTATSFDIRPYGTELALCQRYYYKKQGAAYTFSGYAANTVSLRASGHFPVTMRTPATALEQSGTASHYTVVGGGQSSAVCSAVPTFLTADVDNWQITATVASGLVAYNSGVVNINSSGYLAWSAEL